MKLPIMHPVVKVPCNVTQPYSREHPAVDWSYSGAYKGKLRAPFPGVVIVAKETNTTAGTSLFVRGTGLYEGLIWYDYHIDTLYVKVGQTVKAGQTVALIGFTGYCIPPNKNGAHLHFGICSKLLSTMFPNKSTCYNPYGEKFKIYTDLDAYTKAVAAIQPTPAPTPVPKPKPVIYRVTAIWLYKRAAPAGKKLGKVYRNGIVAVTRISGDWAQDKTGFWVSTKYLKKV